MYNDEKLNCVLSYATQNVEFYNQIFGTYTPCYFDFPIIDKNTVLNNEQLFKVSNNSMPIIDNWTSGTSGKPFRISWTVSDYQKSYFQLWMKRRKWYDITPSCRCLTFHSATTNANNNPDDLLINNSTLSIRKDVIFRFGLEKYIKIIEEFSPVWILGAPSMLLYLAQFLNETNRRIPSLKYIELNGENVQPNAFNYIRDFFRVEISNLYGAIEFNGIALSCPNGTLHILDQNVFVESYKEDLLITSLSNRFMPLIRYRIGDRGIVGQSNCICGNTDLCLCSLHGRNSENIYCGETMIPKSIFTRIIEEINIDEPKVKQYQIIVDSNNSKIMLYLLVKTEYKREMLLSRIHYIDFIRLLSGNRYTIYFDICVFDNCNSLIQNKNGKFDEILYI